MLMAFFAITVAAAILVRRPFWERCLIALSAVPIGIAVNVMRISATAIVHERVGPELADRVFHDFAGWLMPLVAIGLLAAEMHFLSKLLIPAERRAAMPDLMVKRPGVESS
jgi:exosortase/archaeosortase family protein